MTYVNLKSLVDEAYATFCKNYITRERLGADENYSKRQLFFVKSVYKTLMNQSGDETLDQLTKEDIQNCITMFNKLSNSIVQIEYE